MRIFSLLFLGVSLSLVAAEPSPVDLTKIDRKILREPQYAAQPHYALFLFGPQAEHKVWFVVDGDSLAYIDRNADGDLTDPEDKIELDRERTNQVRPGKGSGAVKAMHHFDLGQLHGTPMKFILWIHDSEFDVSQERPMIRDWYRKLRAHHWGNGSLYRTLDGTSSQSPLLLTTTPGEAQISRFAGPVTFSRAFANRKLEPWPKQTHLSFQIGWKNLSPDDSENSGFNLTRLATSEVPPDLHPRGKLVYLDASGNPHEQEFIVDSRCCGDQFHTFLRLPRNVAGETLKLTVRFPSDSPLPSIPAEFEIPLNRELSEDAEELMVFFHDPALELTDAVNVLRKSGLEVQIVEDSLMISGTDEDALLGIRLNRTPLSQRLAVELSTSGLVTDASAKQSLDSADAMFEVFLRKPQYWIDEKSTLEKIRTSLLTLTQGHSHSTWNQQPTP